MRPAPLHRFSYAEYLALEETSNVKHEYWDGEIYAMGGGSPAHAALAMSIGSALVPQLRAGPCRVYSSDLRVRVLSSGLTTYPDVTVVCGELEVDPKSPSTITNPKVLVEVLSESTEAYDRGEKLEQYKTIPSLDAVLLVSQSSRRVELHRRVDRGFRVEVLTDEDLVELPCIGVSLELALVYRDAGL